jgi:hypothetical protein
MERVANLLKKVPPPEDLVMQFHSAEPSEEELRRLFSSRAKLLNKSKDVVLPPAALEVLKPHPDDDKLNPAKRDWQPGEWFNRNRVPKPPQKEAGLGKAVLPAALLGLSLAPGAVAQPPKEKAPVVHKVPQNKSRIYIEPMDGPPIVDLSKGAPLIPEKKGPMVPTDDPYLKYRTQKAKLLRRAVEVKQYGQPTPANPMDEEKKVEKDLKIKKPMLPGQPGNPPQNDATNGPLLQQSAVEKEAERTILPAEPPPNPEKKSPYAYDPHMKEYTHPIAQPTTEEEGAVPEWVTGSKRAKFLNKKAAITPGGSWETVQTPDGQFRFVNHAEKLATTGFGSEEALMRNADIIRVDKGTLKLMRERYLKEFPQHQASKKTPTGLRRRRDYGESKVAIGVTPGAPGPDYKAVTKDKSIYNDAAPAGDVGEGPAFPSEEVSAAKSRAVEARNRRQANDDLAALCRKYHANLPIQEIKAILVKHGFNGEAMDGIYTGRDGKMHEQCGPRTWVAMTWHKLERSGLWEIVAYVS